jgi:hypothetical protein
LQHFWRLACMDTPIRSLLNISAIDSYGQHIDASSWTNHSCLDSVTSSHFIKTRNETNMSPEQNQDDFFVVGGGTAGRVVAARLAEKNPDVSVLVLEAGSNALQDPRIAVPAMWSAILGTELDWDFLTTPQVCYIPSLLSPPPPPNFSAPERAVLSARLTSLSGES